jgi:hypothetical protein
VSTTASGPPPDILNTPICVDLETQFDGVVTRIGDERSGEDDAPIRVLGPAGTRDEMPELDGGWAVDRDRDP